MISHQFLWYLIQIDKYQSFSLAAENLHISQPSLSIAIKKLEEQLNLQLVDRQYHKTTLTEDGKKVVDLASKGFNYFNRIEQYAIQKNQKQLSPLLDNVIIYCNPFLSNTLTMSFVDLFKEQHFNLQISNLNPHLDIIRLLQENPNAVVIEVISKTTALPQDLDMVVLQESKSYIMCSHNSPFFQNNQTSTSFKDLLKVPLILTNNAFEIQDVLLGILKMHGEPIIKTVAPDIPSMLKLINKDLGVSFASKLGMPIEHSDYSERYLLIRNAPKFQLCLFYNKNIAEENILMLQSILQRNFK